MFSKRKSDILEEEEDEWEKEAASSSTTHSSFRKPVPSNPYAIQIDILNDQHNKLSETETALAKQFEELELSLKMLEEEEEAQQKKADKAKQDYLNTADETIKTFEVTKNTLTKQSKGDLPAEKTDDYLEIDALLSDQLDEIMTKWKLAYQKQNLPTKNQKDVENLAYKFRIAEFEIIDLFAQIEGYEARIQTLDRLKSKLNGLPQLPHILKSEINAFNTRMQTTTQILAQLEKESIRPRLESLVELRVILPLEKDRFRKKLDMLNDLIIDLERLYKLSIQQRACQQLVSYTNDRNQFDIIHKSQLLKDASDQLEQQLSRFITDHTDTQLDIMQRPTENKDVGDATMMKSLLDEFFESHYKQYTHDGATNKSVVEQFQALKRLEISLKRKWEADFQSCLGDADELINLQQRLSGSLFTHSNSKENLIMTPKPYTDLQTALQYRTDEIEAAIQELEKNAEDRDANELFEQKKKLFSLFFTDPITFEQLHMKYL